MGISLLIPSILISVLLNKYPQSLYYFYYFSCQEHVILSSLKVMAQTRLDFTPELRYSVQLRQYYDAVGRDECACVFVYDL
jgi:hypothetical protein